MEVIFIIGTGMAFFFEILLLQKRNKSLSDIILAVWMFVIGFHLFSAYGMVEGWHFQAPVLIMIFAPFPLLHGPFLWLYVLSLTRESRKLRSWDYLHFIPFFLGLLVFLPLMQMPNAAFLEYINQLEAGAPQPWTFALLGFGVQASGLIYAFFSYLRLQAHQKRIKERFSFNEEVSLQWLRYLIIAIGVIYLIVIVSIILEEQLDLLSHMMSEYIIYTTVTVFVFFFGYYGIRQERIFVEKERLPSSQAGFNNTSGAERYSRSGLKAEQVDDYYRQLLDVMEKEQPYLESKLTLQQLAEALELSPNHLSQVINEKAGQNFYQFVNSYRIKVFKEKLKDPSNQHLTLLALAMDCGFNSKSSFNHIFKKFTGMTPSQYQRSVS